MYDVSCCLMSLVSEFGVGTTVEGNFRCGLGRIFAMMKSASHMWLCYPWARWWQCLFSIVDSFSWVIVGFSIL